MKAYVLNFKEIDKTKLMAVGGKGLNLGQLSRIEGLRVPDGFCVTTEAYRKSIESSIELEVMIDKLSGLKSDNRELTSEISSEIRSTIEKLVISKDIENEIEKALFLHGENEAYAVRSSATAEDLPNASFAGQQDTYLNVKGKTEVLRHVVKCWASLFTDRAVIYRIQNGFDHKKVFISVVVQKMIMSEVSGIMFTADPMNSDRKTLSIDAGFGLGEALVSGLVNPDNYKVQAGKIIEKNIGTQKLEIKPSQNGGVEEMKVEADRQKRAALSDNHIEHLAAIGKRIEAYFNYPQDIEWCFANNDFYIVQSRPITTLFPIPQSIDVRNPRIYMSIGHTQMMTDAIKPLGMSFFEMISQFSLDKSGGRLYADITHDMASAMGKKRVLMATGKQDPLILSAVKKLMEDKAFMASLPKGKRNLKGGVITGASILQAIKISKKNNPAIIDELLAEFEEEFHGIDQQLSKLSGEQALEFIREDREKLLAMSYDARMLGAIIAGIMVNDSLNKNVEKLLGEKNVADTLSKSMEHNVTTEMSFALCELADEIRKYPKILTYISNEPSDEGFFEKMLTLPGGNEVYKAFKVFLDKYGMRCPGEIDITKARWEEQPTQLIPMLLNNIRVLEPGRHVERFKKGRQEAKEKEAELIRRVKALSGGNKKAKKIAKSISLLRNFIGCREYPKYYIVRRYQVYKKALMKEAEMLAAKGVICNREDIYYLYFDELCQVVKTNKLDNSIIEARKANYIHYEKLTPPRIITSDGFVPSCAIASENIPKGALPGIAVSSGVVEGRARVVLSVDEAKLEAGDILVTQFTDPSWTPLFVNIKGLVTEVGGFTTHGAVITREYGLPGVVGVENAIKLIKDGQRIRVNGTEGYIEVLE
ncbi:MAG: phosphoenolpyruvate synthase [Clostridia bacterium]|nr:phosphoenolpyruvate synthase [Clostridia bacterium]